MILNKPAHPRLPPNIQALLAGLRRRIRWYVGLQGVGTVVALVGAAFWISLAVDWFFEPPTAIRAGLLVLGVLALLWVLVEMLLRRALVPLADHNVAMLLERRFPQFDESLLTAVELTAAGRHDGRSDPLYRGMLAHTCRLAAERATGLELASVFNPRPLRQRMVAAVLLAAAVGVFGVRYPQATAVWARRSLLFADELYPRKTSLVVEGFPNGVAKIARGTDLEVIAKADLSRRLVPKLVKVRYQTAHGGQRQETMTRIGRLSSAKDRFQEFTYTFSGVLSPIRFDVVGGDDCIRDLRIEVVDSPTIIQMELDVRFPPYMNRQPRTLPVTGVMQLPMGAEITIRAVTNKDLVSVTIGAEKGTGTLCATHPEGRSDKRCLPPFPSPPTVSLDLADGPDRRSFQYTLSNFSEDVTLLFTLLDTDGVESRQPLRLELVALADQPPKLAIELGGIGSAVTPLARLPAAGRISDDYGVASIWFEYALDRQEPRQEPIDVPTPEPTDFEFDHALDLEGLEISPGQRLLVSVQAADRCELAGGVNTGSSERWLLDVVTKEQLRAILESRELVLRQRFEMIIADVVQTRDLVENIEFDIPNGPERKADESAADKPNAASEGTEPGDEPAGQRETSARQTSSLRRLRIERALQNSQKDAHEILAVVVAFEDVNQQLINNRIDTTELRIRLQEGIADPLRRMVERMFPELDRRLNEFQAMLADDRMAAENRDLAVAQLDAILLAMREVLSRMIELEDFNEAVELLRQIIDAHEDLKAQTEQRHKDKLRELLEE